MAKITDSSAKRVARLLNWYAEQRFNYSIVKLQGFVLRRYGKDGMEAVYAAW